LSLLDPLNSKKKLKQVLKSVHFGHAAFKQEIVARKTCTTLFQSAVYQVKINISNMFADTAPL
jgi:hypothetical protein